MNVDSFGQNNKNKHSEGRYLISGVAGKGKLN